MLPIQFGKLRIGDRFAVGDAAYEKVPFCIDRLGGYNAQRDDGKRYLFLSNLIVRKRPGAAGQVAHSTRPY